MKVLDFTIRPDEIDFLLEKYAWQNEFKGMPAIASMQYANMVVRGLLHQLKSRPLQMRSIEFLRETCPGLSTEQGILSGRQKLKDWVMPE